jgi:probable addiction module antidote protein
MTREAQTMTRRDVAYLNKTRSLSRDHFLVALMNVIKVHGVQDIERMSGVKRRTMYRAFRHGGNPRVLTTLFPVLQALHIKIVIMRQDPKQIAGRK